MHDSTFAYVKPDAAQLQMMDELRAMFRNVALSLDHALPDGPDKTYVIRKLREVAMWANVAVTRHADGAPRRSIDVDVGEYPPDHPVKGDLGSVPT